ncbi:ADP-ribosylglycohydrolase family protein [Streptomyces sp. NPDC054861]
MLFGLALGDAMGYPTEFLTMEQIGARFGPWHTMELPLSPGGGVRVSDDTQMMLAVGEALAEATGSPDSAAQGRAARGAEGERDVRGGRRPQGAAQQGGASLTPAAAETALRKHFVRWLRDPDNNRAPGRTCLDACAALERDVPWQAASIVTSKGCGANMRVAPVALVPGLTAEQRSGLAQLQAALTHGHPTALAASDLTAHAVWLLVNACPLPHLLDELRAYARASQRTYHADWLGDLAQRAGAPDPETYIAFGWDESLRALDRVSEALREPDVDQDPSTVVGAGWVAEEALATALYCFLVVGGDARHALRRAAHSSGDSDSIAALAGAFAGAVHGIKYWPPEWREVIEYGDRLSALGTAWD